MGNFTTQNMSIYLVVIRGNKYPLLDGSGKETKCTSNVQECPLQIIQKTDSDHQSQKSHWLEKKKKSLRPTHILIVRAEH
jgi:hypothetical protein